MVGTDDFVQSPVGIEDRLAARWISISGRDTRCLSFFNSVQIATWN
jgi:hypothetical protein